MKSYVPEAMGGKTQQRYVRLMRDEIASCAIRSIHSSTFQS